MKLNRYTLLTFVALLVIVVALPFYAAQERQRQRAAQTRLHQAYTADAGILYLNNCVACHGLDGAGIGANPPLNTAALATADEQLLFQTIAHPPHGSGMSAWHTTTHTPLNAYQVTQLVTLLRVGNWSNVQAIAANQNLAAPDLPPPDVETAFLEEVTAGDPHQCAACHEEPEVHNARFGLDCVRCHTLQAWQPALLARHTFSLDHGSAASLTCDTCHVDTYVSQTCYGCHDHQVAQMESVHTAFDITVLEPCAACHPTGVPGEAEHMAIKTSGH